MIKVVIDTNVFISSFFGDNPKKIIDLWKKGEIKLCLSRKIVDEYVEILKRLGLQNENELQELLNIFSEGHSIKRCPPLATCQKFFKHFLDCDSF